MSDNLSLSTELFHWYFEAFKISLPDYLLEVVFILAVIAFALNRRLSQSDLQKED